MKKRLYFSLIVVSFLCVAVWTAHAQLQRSNSQQTWEYQEVQLSAATVATPALNRLGAQGWELVGVTAACPNVASGTCLYYAYLKRAK